ILSASYFFKQITNIEDKASSFNQSDDTIQQLEIYSEKFKLDTNWSLEANGLQIINDFESLIREKKLEYEKFKRNYNNKGNFINLVNSVINIQNSKLDNNGKEKGAANRRISLLKSNIDLILQKAREFEEICLEIENYKYNFRQKIE